MRLDVSRLIHLRRLHRDRLAAYRAANDHRLEQREQVQDLERERAVFVMNHGEGREAEALAALDKRITAAKADLAAMTEREAELASASSTAGRTFASALEFAQEQGLDLPDDMKPKPYGAPARPVTEA